MPDIGWLVEAQKDLDSIERARVAGDIDNLHVRRRIFAKDYGPRLVAAVRLAGMALTWMCNHPADFSGDLLDYAMQIRARLRSGEVDDA